MIVTRLVSGLGNQFFQYAIARSLSIKYGVALKLDTSFFKTQTLRSFELGNYNINAEVATDTELKKFLFWQKDTSLAARIYRKAQQVLPRTKRNYFKELEWWAYDPELLNAASEVYLDGYWQHYKYFLDISPFIFEELSLKEIIPRAKELERSIVQNPSSVSIHIRRGDYTTDGLMGTLPMAYYASAIEYMNSETNRPSYYIFSDDLQWAKDNLEVKAPVTFVDLHDNANKDCVELDLMSKCSHNIIANSSYSWWGAFMNRNPGKVVICPATWVKQPEVNARIQLQFPSWIKM